MARRRLRELEIKYDKPIERIVPELFESYGSVSDLCKAEQVQRTTLYKWIDSHGYELVRSMRLVRKETEPAA